MVLHNIPPLFSTQSRILILGSFPSVKSREAAFFYGHPQNRFWKVLAAVYGMDTPVSVSEKKALVLEHGLALWDVIARCAIRGSSDASIGRAEPNDLRAILAGADIRRIFCNGGTAFALYEKHLLPATGRAAVRLPSTSPAAARYTYEQKLAAWRDVLGPYLPGR